MGGTIRVSNPERGKKFFPSPNRPYRLWGPHILPFKGYRRSFFRGKQQQREVDATFI